VLSTVWEYVYQAVAYQRPGKMFAEPVAINGLVTCLPSGCLETMGGIHIQVHRQQGDFIRLLLFFFKTRKIDEKHYMQYRNVESYHDNHYYHWQNSPF
jgi:hypothetical protein